MKGMDLLPLWMEKRAAYLYNNMKHKHHLYNLQPQNSEEIDTANKKNVLWAVGK